MKSAGELPEGRSHTFLQMSNSIAQTISYHVKLLWTCLVRAARQPQDVKGIILLLGFDTQQPVHAMSTAEQDLFMALSVQGNLKAGCRGRWTLARNRFLCLVIVGTSQHFARVFIAPSAQSRAHAVAHIVLPNMAVTHLSASPSFCLRVCVVHRL